jgi:hypothetical protein
MDDAFHFEECGGIDDLRERVENIAAIGDETLTAKAVHALDCLLHAWSDHQVALLLKRDW